MPIRKINKLIIYFIVGSTFILANCTIQGKVIKLGEPESTEYFLSHQQAEKDFHYLAKKTKYEDGWLFFNDKCIDINNAKSPDTLGPIYWNVMTIIYKNPSRTYTWIHLHPKQPNDFIYPPSVGDIIFHSGIKEAIYNYYSPTPTLWGEVYDGYGVWKFDTTDKLDYEISRWANHDENYKNFSAEFNKKIKAIRQNILNDTSETRSSRINDYKKEIMKLGLIVDYTPLD